jgi:hypothetical protein
MDSLIVEFAEHLMGLEKDSLHDLTAGVVAQGVAAPSRVDRGLLHDFSTQLQNVESAIAAAW